ncbi:hypothetical protein [Mesorhizobium sp.]|uniref:hypothetical protein n=1 Tax=Mesorhizobium sp. TaxID=1871066 RepID=UPI002580A017|nr:hypothetical protein [Mesorhizobium sp.]
MEAHAPGFSDLPEPDRRAIFDFAFLWSLFEAQVMGNFARADRIREKVDAWAAAETLGADLYGAELAYYQNRYFADGKLTRHFPFLDLRPSDHPDLVQAVVECANNDPRDRMLALLISSGACATTSSMAPNGRMGFAINARISLTKTRLCGCSNGTANSADAAGTHGRADPDFRKSAFAPLRGRLSPAPEPVVSVDPSCGRPRNAPCRVRVQTGFAVTG